jgi:hypothetical protein
MYLILLHPRFPANECWGYFWGIEQSLGRIPPRVIPPISWSPAHAVPASTRFKQEPGAALSFVNPVFDQTCRRNVAVFVDDLADFPKASYERQHGPVMDPDAIGRLPRAVRAEPPSEYERLPGGTPALGPPVGACPAPNVAEC